MADPIAGAANDLTTLEDVKSYLGTAVTGEMSDTLLTKLITAASAWARNYCEDEFFSATYTHVVSGWGSAVLMLPYGPLTAVTSVTIDGTQIPERISTLLRGWTWNPREQAVRLTGYRFSEGQNNIAIVYTAGYSSIEDVPYDLQFAVTRLVAYRYKERSRIGKITESLNGQAVTYETAAAPADVTRTLDNFKRRHPVC